MTNKSDKERDKYGRFIEICLDYISGQVLKECSEELTEPISDKINCSISTGGVLKEWRNANMTPTYKNGDREEPLN